MQKFIFFTFIMLAGWATSAQSIVLEGKVTDEKGQALQGATVFIPDLKKEPPPTPKVIF
ncbi:MAG: hypothetical protein R2784_14955 [Saprospiraceae bacterium]